MSTETLRKKITESLSKMDEIYLRQAYEVFNEIMLQQKYSKTKIDKETVERKISKGLEQLDNGEGTDFRLFLNEMQATYAKKSEA